MATSRVFLWLAVILAFSIAIGSVNARPQESEAEELGPQESEPEELGLELGPQESEAEELGLEDRKFGKLVKFAGKVGPAAFKYAKKLFKKGLKKLPEVVGHFYNDETMVCNWNDWRTRDARARKTRTYKTCRFSQQKRVLWWVTGTWYCTMTPEACQVKGHRLD